MNFFPSCFTKYTDCPNETIMTCGFAIDCAKKCDQIALLERERGDKK